MSPSGFRLWPFVLLVSLLVALPVSAQQSDVQKDVPRLQWRYDSLLKAKTPQAAEPIQNGIDNERAAIRQEIEQGLTKTIQTAGKTPEATDLVRVLDQQRSIVSLLSQRIDAAKADIALLEKEAAYYVQRAKTGTGSPPPGLIMQTKSYPELLAKKAILGEQLSALQAMQNTQQERLDELQSEQQVRDIGVLFNILTYLAIFFGVFWAERLVRNLLLHHIRHRRVRYAATKVFSFIVYVTLAFWFIQRVFSEFPDIVTIFALVGAAFIIVMQDPIKGMVGWFGLRNSISIGQRVAIGDVVGDVIDVGILYTTLIVSRTMNAELMGHVGKLVRIPNQKMLLDPLVNFHSTSDFENVEMPIRLRKSGQYEQAKGILEEILQKETGDFALQAQRQIDRRMRGYYFTQISPAPRAYVEVTPTGEIEFRLCFPAPIGRRRVVMTQITQEILRRFAENQIELRSSDTP
ncbi:MAG: hypothetical protein V1876_00960 [Candidatus Peregrinibacteria bacterium]